MSNNKQADTATLAGGCFWCIEAVFKRIKGVISVESGYSGGEIENPTYKQVSMGNTGHAESVQLKFDPSIISYREILDIFWHLHDPTTLNRQGNDVGSQYRSVIFYHDKNQENLAKESKVALENEGVYKNPIVTEIVPFNRFYPAEEYHNDYYDNNRGQSYCTFIIDPKIKKLLEKYEDKVKDQYVK